MRRENKKRNKIIIGLISLLLLMTVGYAAFQTNLNIKGTSKISSNWNIRITNVTSGNKTGNAENAKTPTWTNLTASMEANLYEKGDAMEYEVTVENKGTFDAKLEDIITNIKSNNEAIKISFSGYTKGEKLYKNTSKTVNVKIEYNKDFNGTPPTNSSEVEITLDYGQAEGGTITPTNDYLVTYDYKTNGGTSSTSQNEYLSEGDKIDLSYTATKAGWTFAGWNTNKDATVGLSTIEMKNADVTLYAIYKKTINVSYTKGTGISAIGKTTDSCTMWNRATTCQITLPSITALTGYGVDGWYNSSNTKVGTEGTKVNVSSNITYTAKGKANSYTLTYNYNGATGGNSTTSKAVTYNSTYGTLPSPTRSYVVTYNYNSATSGNTTANATSNYTFNGWYKESTFTNQVTSSTIYNTVGNSTIYAKWTGTSIVLPTPTKTGYTFSGWYSNSSFTNKVGDGGSSYTPTSSLTLYAKWTINSYNVTYNYSQNGGTTSTKTTATVNYGSSIDLSPTATKSGWTFVGWNTNKDATVGLTSLNMNTSNVTLYAIYRKEAVTLTAKFNGNGATLSSTSNLTCTIPAVYNNASQATSCNVSAPSITRSGYNIIGYNTATGSTTNNSSYNASSKVLTLTTSNNNSTWYAITSKVVTITFNKNGASSQTNGSGTAVSDTTVIRTCSMYNTNTTCNVTSPTIVGASGFSVVGYNTSSSSTTSAWNHNTSKAVSANATYYAVTSKAAKTITIIFNANGASAIGSTSQSCTIPAVYNGASQATSCNITSPSITASSNTPTVVGWSTA
ncbi:MAG: InlB B-repeat-containing protein [Bacilli bacterium]